MGSLVRRPVRPEEVPRPARSRVVVDTLERMGPKFPKVNPEVLEIARQWELEATGRRKIDE